MSKKTREEKREEERRIIAEMEEALQEKAESENVQNASQTSAHIKHLHMRKGDWPNRTIPSRLPYPISIGGKAKCVNFL